MCSAEVVAISVVDAPLAHSINGRARWTRVNHRAFRRHSVPRHPNGAKYGTQIEKLKKAGKSPTAEMLAEMEKVRKTYDRELDAKHAAARGLVDAIVTPENLRVSLILALKTCLNTNTPHIGAFVLPTIA